VRISPLLHLLLGGGGLSLVQSGIARQIEGLGRKREPATRFFDNIHDAQKQIFANCSEFVRVTREHKAGDLDPQGAAINLQSEYLRYRFLPSDAHTTSVALQPKDNAIDRQLFHTESRARD